MQRHRSEIRAFGRLSRQGEGKGHVERQQNGEKVGSSGTLELAGDGQPQERDAE